MIKRIALSVIVLLLVAGVSGYYLNKRWFANLATGLFVNEQTAALIPSRFHSRIHAIRKPLNKGTEAIVKEMHDSGITIDQLTAVIDKTSEKQAYDLLDEFNRTQPKTTNEVFSLLQDHLVTDFDSEILRKPFNEHLNMKQVKKAVFYLNQNRKTHDVEFATAKEIMKLILVEADRDFRKQLP